MCSSTAALSPRCSASVISTRRVATSSKRSLSTFWRAATDPSCRPVRLSMSASARSSVGVSPTRAICGFEHVHGGLGQLEIAQQVGLELLGVEPLVVVGLDAIEQRQRLLGRGPGGEHVRAQDQRAGIVREQRLGLEREAHRLAALLGELCGELQVIDAWADRRGARGELLGAALGGIVAAGLLQVAREIRDRLGASGVPFSTAARGLRAAFAARRGSAFFFASLASALAATGAGMSSLLLVSMRRFLAGAPSASPMRRLKPHAELVTHTFTSRRFAPACALAP